MIFPALWHKTTFQDQIIRKKKEKRVCIKYSKVGIKAIYKICKNYQS